MPYTLGLLSSIPRTDRGPQARLDPIPGNPPSPINLPPGCVFQPRCKYWQLVPESLGDPRTVRPELVQSGPNHYVRCLLPPEERRRISREVLESLSGSIE
jgi:peptide/nickel transport system ATP-binding protein